MKKTFAKVSALILAAVLAAGVLAGCKNKGEATDTSSASEQTAESPALIGSLLTHETEFGGIYFEKTIDEFNALGFAFGDSVDIVFSNGYRLEDIPYYNGYYVDAGMPLLVGYPGYPFIRAGFNYGEDMWVTAGVDEETTADITLHERGKYLDVQEARNIQYEDERSKYPSDEVFANFRNMTVGNLIPGVIYRSASPCDNQHKRAPFVDALMKEAGVNCILNLADNTEKIERYIAAEDFNSPCFLELYRADKVIPLAMSMNYSAEDFRQKVVSGLTQLSGMEGPYLVHCTEGKDRTGFMCMLIEALAGASYQEIVDDYMLTYDNYYQINPELDPAKYTTIKEKNLDVMIRYIVNDESVDITTADMSVYAEKFLIDAGMSEDALETLKDRLIQAAN